MTAGLSEPSSTRLLADLLGEATASRRWATRQVEVVELRPLAHAVTDALLTGFPNADLAQAIETVTGADAVIAVTPVFSGSYSGLFKSFFDILESGALDGTPVLVAATAGTARHSLVLEHALRPLFSYLHAVVVPTGCVRRERGLGRHGRRRCPAPPDRPRGRRARRPGAVPPDRRPGRPVRPRRRGDGELRGPARGLSSPGTNRAGPAGETGAGYVKYCLNRPQFHLAPGETDDAQSARMTIRCTWSPFTSK